MRHGKPLAPRAGSLRHSPLGCMLRASVQVGSYYKMTEFVLFTAFTVSRMPRGVFAPPYGKMPCTAYLTLLKEYLPGVPTAASIRLPCSCSKKFAVKPDTARQYFDIESACFRAKPISGPCSLIPPVVPSLFTSIIAPVMIACPTPVSVISSIFPRSSSAAILHVAIHAKDCH